MRVAVISAILLSCSVAIAQDENWNQFRGPRGDGVSHAKGLPVKFGDDSPEIVWKTPIPGRAWSSPVIWGKQIWVTNAPDMVQGTKPERPKLDKPIELSAVCLDLDSGKIIHDLKLFEVTEPQVTHPTNTFASPTPYVEEGRVYIHFGAYGTACLDTKTGRKIWERRDLECDHFRGPGSSPIVYGDLLYLTFDGVDVQYITALDKWTGKNVWRTDRNIDYGTTDGDAKKGYSAPILINDGGRELLISPFAKATIAYNPKTGEPIWTVRHGGMNTAGRPLYGNGLVYITTGDVPNLMVALPPKGKGDVTENIAWKNTKQIPRRPSPILWGDLIFMMNDGGVAMCIDAKTSEEVWTKRLEGDYWSSPLLADGLIYCFAMSTGTVQVFKASREFEQVAENHLDNGFVASPAVAGKSLIVRSKTALYRIEKVNEQK